MFFFALKVAGYLWLARDLAHFAWREFEEILDFNDLLSSRSAFQFQSFVEDRFLELGQDREDLGCLVHIWPLFSFKLTQFNNELLFEKS